MHGHRQVCIIFGWACPNTGPSKSEEAALKKVPMLVAALTWSEKEVIYRLGSVGHVNCCLGFSSLPRTSF